MFGVTFDGKLLIHNVLQDDDLEDQLPIALYSTLIFYFTQELTMRPSTEAGDPKPGLRQEKLFQR